MENFMKKMWYVSILLFVFSLSSAALAATNSWVSVSGPSSWYRSPVTSGYCDIRVLVENATFTNLVFTFNYDSTIVNTIGSGNVFNIIPGLNLVSVTNQNLEGTWKKATITLSGNVKIDAVQYTSGAVFLLRITPIAEGLVPVTLWPEGYPERYNTCSLTLTNGTEEVVHQEKEWNGGTELFTFTDKTGATLYYQYDMNFGYPLEGFVRVTYLNETVEDFYTSDHARGITIDLENGAYYVSPQPNAVSYVLILEGYGSSGNLTLNGGRYTSHSQPENVLYIPEKYTQFHGTIQASSQPIVLTVGADGLGTDFVNSTYRAAMAGDIGGVLEKTFTFAYIDDNTVQLTIEEGLEPEYHQLYVYKNEKVVGRSWFNTSVFYPVTFNVSDENANPMQGATIRLVLWGMNISFIDDVTDENGQAVIGLPGAEWGNYHEYNAVAAGYDIATDYALIYDSPITVNITMTPAAGINIEDVAAFAASWQDVECYYYGNCNGADMNVDGVVDPEDLMLLAARWLKD